MGGGNENGLNGDKRGETKEEKMSDGNRWDVYGASADESRRKERPFMYPLFSTAIRE